MQEKFTLVLAADGSAMITTAGKAEAAIDGISRAANEANASLGRMPQAAAGLGKVDQSLKQVGMSAAATSAALRNVPAQFTDIVVSLQGGMSPMTVLLQQGGQLKDMFGGIGPAARALGGYVAGLVSPLTAGAAAVAAVGYAAYQAREEIDRFRSSVLMTGNAAGTSVGQLQSMAYLMGQGFGQTTGKSAEALTALVGTGRVASANLVGFAQTAIDMEKSFGQSIETTAKHFAELGKDPVGASLRLNESLNYLTASTYEQIRAAKALGQDELAAALAQDAYAKAMKPRTDNIVENLGALERSWGAVKRAAKGAWDAMLDIDRPDSAAEKLAKLQSELADREQSLRQFGNRGGVFGDDTATRVAKLKEQIGLLQESERMLKRGNESQAERNALEKAGIAATDAVAKANERAATKQEQLNKALKDYRDNLAAIRAVNPSSAALDPAQVAKTEAAIRDQFKTAQTPGESEAQRQAKAYVELTQSIRAKIDAQALELAQGAAVTAAQKQQIEIERLVATGKISAKDASSEKTQALLKELTASEELLRLDREEIKANEEAEKRYAASLATQQKSLDTLEAEIDKQRQSNEALGLGKVAIAQLEAAKLSEQAVSKERLATLADETDWTGQLSETYRAQAAALRELAKLKEQGAAKEVVVEEAKKATEAWTKFTDQVNQSLTDSLMRAFESGGNFFKTFWNSVVNTFKTTVLKMLIQPVVGAMTGFLGMGPASAGQGVGDAANTVNSLKNIYQTGQTAYSVGGQWMAGTMSSANAAGTLGANATSTGIDGLLASNGAYGTAGSTATTLGSAATLLGGALVGFLAGKMISGGYSAVGKSGNTAVVVGTAIGAAVGGPIGAIIGGAIGGSVNRLFGRKAAVSTAEGISGEFTTGGANVQGFTDMLAKGGTFRSSRRWTQYSAIDAGLQGALDQGLALVTKTAKDYADILGLNADSINGITQSVRINLKGLDAAGREKAITDALGGFGDKLAEQLLKDASAFMQAGETAGAALARLGGNLSVVNGVFDTLNATLLQGSLAGAEVAGQLIDVFGGMDKFTQATSAYYNAFYSEAERSATATRQLTKVFADLGLSLPGSKDAFRALVEAQDLTTEAGRETYATLIGLAPAFDQITQALAQLGKGLTDEVQRLRGLLTTSSTNSLAALQSDFAINTAAARAGDKTALERLPGISQALESASALQAVSAADLAIMRGQLAASLEATAAAIGISVPSIAAISPGTGSSGIDPGLPRYTVGPVELPGMQPPRVQPLPVLTPPSARTEQNEAALRQEVRDLKTQMQELVKVMLKNEKNTAETNDLWRRVTSGGEAMRTESTT